MIISCKQSLPECEKVINIDPFIKNKKELLLSEIASDISYIRLETTPESLIGRIKKVRYFDNKFLVLCSQTDQIFIFNSKGTYIAKINHIGRGPGEYLQIRDFTSIPIDTSIMIVDAMQRKVIKYDFTGKFLQEMRWNTNPHNISVLNDSLVALQSNYPDFILNGKYSIALYEKNLKPLKKMIPQRTNTHEERVGYIPSHSLNFFAHVSDTLTFWEYRNDIIYKIINNQEVIQKYYIQYSHKIKQGNMKNFFGVPPDKNELVIFIETENYMFMEGTTFGETFRIVYFKDRDMGYNIAINEYKEDLTNDFDHGPNFYPRGVLDNGQLYKSFSLFNFHENRGKNLPFPEVLKINDDVLFEDNPVIMLVTLK